MEQVDVNSVVDEYGPCTCEWCTEARRRQAWERTVQRLLAKQKVPADYQRPVEAHFVIQEMP